MDGWIVLEVSSEILEAPPVIRQDQGPRQANGQGSASAATLKGSDVRHVDHDNPSRLDSQSSNRSEEIRPNSRVWCVTKVRLWPLNYRL